MSDATPQLNRTGRADPLGFTLLEVLLALALSVVIIAVIATAVRLHLVTLGQQQQRIETKQIARSVISMINNDLRAAIQYKPVDYSGLENLAASQSLIAGIDPNAATGTGDSGTGDTGTGDGGTGDPGAGAGGTGGGSTGNATTGSGDDAQGQQDPEANVTSRPTLYGDSNRIAIDISRFPRIDEYNPLIAADQSTIQLPSDVKSVAYFVDESGTQQNLASDFVTNSSLGGLYRRQIDRAVSAYRGEDEIVVTPDQFARLVAPEVAEIAFRYFDGQDWQEEWDSVERGGFPPAIEVRVVIDHSRTKANPREYSYSGYDANSMEFYRTVVYLPAAELPGG